MDPTQSLILVDTPERVRLRELLAELDRGRDQIAELDLEIETLREELASFEVSLGTRMGVLEHELKRIEGLVEHLERWVELLLAAPRREVGKRGRRTDARRSERLHRDQVNTPEDDEEPAPLPKEPDERLKAAYRRLARRFHPDLARSEEERVRFGNLMARINALYRAGDRERLEAMEGEAGETDGDEGEAGSAEHLKRLEERLKWMHTVLANLREERTQIERSHTGVLYRNVEQARAQGRDLIDEMRGQLRDRIEKAYDNIVPAIRLLEDAVHRYNQSQSDHALKRQPKRGQSAVDRLFDPVTYKRLVRLSLEALDALHVSPHARTLADELSERAATEPAAVRLVLFTYVNELSPWPLPGLETYDDLRLRFAHLAAADEAPLSLEKTLVQADREVEFGVRRATEVVAHLGLRFRDPAMREAVPMALRTLAVRREFKRILGVLGERQVCSACNQEVFGVPLFRTRGLDNLRAHACPSCGHTLASYWMPRGKDVQAVLNPAYLDFELLSEWTFRLGKGSVAMQLLPVQVETSTVGALKKRLMADLFDRYEMGVAAEHVHLHQGKKRVTDKIPLSRLSHGRFVVRLAPEATVSEADALEMLRHRIRNRFKSE